MNKAYIVNLLIETDHVYKKKNCIVTADSEKAAISKVESRMKTYLTEKCDYIILAAKEIGTDDIFMCKKIKGIATGTDQDCKRKV